MEFMNIDDSIFLDYLEDQYDSEHWIFSHITGHRYVYNRPSEKMKEEYKKVYEDFIEVFNDFHYFNEDYIQLIFPNYETISKKIKVLLYIGAPKRHDAMFIEYQNENYICFDIANFYNYINRDIKETIRMIVTHEFVHAFVHEDYQVEEDASYHDKIDYLTFDEGIAHLLAYNENLLECDLEENRDHYELALIKLKEVYDEEDPKIQENVYVEGQVGNYWEKYLCVVGKFYFYDRIGEIEKIYKKGFQGITKELIVDR